MRTIVFLIKVVHPNGSEDYFLERPEKSFNDSGHAAEIVLKQMQEKEPSAYQILIRGYIWEKV